jgi:hypothetical protein
MDKLDLHLKIDADILADFQLAVADKVYMECNLTVDDVIQNHMINCIRSWKTHIAEMEWKERGERTEHNCGKNEK